MGWRDAARKTVVGEKLTIDNVKPDEDTLTKWKDKGYVWTEYWMRPKKYSVGGKDRVDEITSKNASQIPAEVKVKITNLMEEGVSEEDVFKRLTDEDKAKMMDVQLMSGNNEELVRVIIEEGLSETNLIEGKETVADFAEAVLEFQEISMELVEKIRKHNVPLASKTEKK